MKVSTNNNNNMSSTISIVAVLVCGIVLDVYHYNNMILTPCLGFTQTIPITTPSTITTQRISRATSFGLRSTSSSVDDSEFTTFAATLVDNENDEKSAKTTAAGGRKSSSTMSSSNYKKTSWQAEVDKLLDPTLSSSQRQTVLSNLLNANEEIRSSVLKALQDRNIDALLTPSQRKLQDGTRAVARQVTNDIIPLIAATVTSPDKNLATTMRPPSPDDVSRAGARFFNAMNTQIRQNLETFAGDIMNPSRIPQRISQQTEDLMKEVQNVFSETPVGLPNPKYAVVYTTDSYEVRDYEGYNVATTNMGSANDDEGPTFLDGSATSATDIRSLTEQGAAFNTLAAYIFGANQQKLVMDMTTPVTTTMSGEMRFYVDVPVPPAPLEQDDSKTSNNPYQEQKIFLQYIPPTRLAVRRFTGFVTAGEVARQKDALLSAIAMDYNSRQIEIDVPHGSAVGHVIFQYNPPYTIPFVRRNEIAVPVILLGDDDV